MGDNLNKFGEGIRKTRISPRAKKGLVIGLGLLIGGFSLAGNICSIPKVFTYNKVLNSKNNMISNLEKKIEANRAQLNKISSSEKVFREQVGMLKRDYLSLVDANREKTVYSFETPVVGSDGKESWKMVSLTSKGSLVLPDGEKFPVGEYVVGEVISAINKGEINTEFRTYEAFDGFKKALDKLEYNVTKLNYGTDDMKAIEGMFQ